MGKNIVSFTAYLLDSASPGLRIDHGARDRADWWAIVLGLGGLVFTTFKWLLIIAVVMPIAGAVTGFLSRGKSRTLR